MDRLQKRKNFLLQHKEVLKVYLLHKFKLGDWHGVEDAASDIRDVDAELRGLDGLL